MKARLLWKVIIGFSLITTGLSAQISISGQPVSFSRSTKATVQEVAMTGVDRRALLAEDALEPKEMPFRFGYAFDVAYNLHNSGTWEQLDDGSRLWRLRIACPGAFSINIIYDRFRLPDGAKFYVYNENQTHILGAFTSQNNKDHGQFATAPVKGEVCILEYEEPPDAAFPGEISLKNIVHAYKNLFDFDVVKDAVTFGESGACNNNVNCPVGLPWQNEKRSIAMILTQSGQRICSGALINNARQDLIPYFLTANHCLGGEETWIFMFNYESPSCTNIDGPTYMTTSGSTLRANNSYSDFALLELDETPPDSFNVFYAGWSIENTATDSSVCIHHPSGDIKKITFDFDSLTSANYAGAPGSGDSHWRIGQWEDGTTEGGSSGAPLFDKNHRIIGQLHGGYASCENIAPDWFGKFAVSWNYGSSSSSRLYDWLDPDNTGIVKLNGRFPSGLLIMVNPLEDTKDSLDDYEVTCEIISQSALVFDSLLLHYQIDGNWSFDILEMDGDSTHFHALIPAQPPGTVIFYYVYARNIEDEFDSSNTYYFRVIDYDVTLEPVSASQSSYGYDTLRYPMSVINTGVYSDNYQLLFSGNDWPTSLWDETGTYEISSSGVIPINDTFTFLVSVEIPGDELMNMTDSVLIEAISYGDDSIKATSLLFSFSSGTPERFPWFEPFLADTLNTESWSYNRGSDISLLGLNPPSSPRSLHLDGGNDTVITTPINLSGQSTALLSYFYQRCGGGEPPDAGDDLTVQYFNDYNEWVNIRIHLGSGPVMYHFEEVNFGLPSEAMHDNFRLRIFSKGTYAGFDDWFVDNIRVDYPPEIDVTPYQLSVSLDLWDSTSEELIITNNGLGGLSYDIQLLPSESFKTGIFAALTDTEKMEPARRKYPDGFHEYEDIKGFDDPRVGFTVEKDAGGPDGYGYTWWDSDDPRGPVFNWLDVSSTGIDVVNSLGDDVSAGPFEIGFEFPYYGSTYTKLYIGSNGIIGFTAQDMASRFKTSIPATSTPNTILAWLWDDLDPTNGINHNAHVYYDTTGERCVIQFVDYPEFGAELGDVVNAEVILYPDGTILFQYLDIAPGFDIRSCAVGIENQNGTDGLEVAYLTSYLHNQLAIIFYRPYQWLKLDHQANSLNPGEADTIICTFTSDLLDPGIYEVNLTIYSNDPDVWRNPWTVPITLTVSGNLPFVCGDVNNSGGDPDISDITYLIAYLYLSGPPPPIPAAADVNSSGGDPDISDITAIIAFLYLNGPDLNCTYY